MAAAACSSRRSFVAPMWLHPLQHSLRPGDHATRRAVPQPSRRADDAERPVRVHRGLAQEAGLRRHGRPVQRRPADPKAYYLYFIDNGTGGREAYEGREGFWLHGGRDAEVIVRALDLKPVRQMVVGATGGPKGDGSPAARRRGEHVDLERRGLRRGDVHAASRLPVLRDVPVRASLPLGVGRRRRAGRLRHPEAAGGMSPPIIHGCTSQLLNAPSWVIGEGEPRTRTSLDGASRRPSSANELTHSDHL